MKKIAGIIGILLTMGYGQTKAQASVIDGKLGGILPTQNGHVVYVQTYSTPGLSKDEVFRRARRWWVYAYNSANDVLQVNDEKAGELIGKGYSSIEAIEKRQSAIRYSLWHTVSFNVSDSGYVTRVSGLQVQNLGPAPRTPIESYKRAPDRSLVRVLTSADEKIQALLSDLNRYILTQQME